LACDVDRRQGRVKLPVPGGVGNGRPVDVEDLVEPLQGGDADLVVDGRAPAVRREPAAALLPEVLDDPLGGEVEGCARPDQAAVGGVTCEEPKSLAILVVGPRRRPVGGGEGKPNLVEVIFVDHRREGVDAGRKAVHAAVALILHDSWKVLAGVKPEALQDRHDVVQHPVFFQSGPKGQAHAGHIGSVARGVLDHDPFVKWLSTRTSGLRSFHIATASVQCSRPPPQVINRSSTGCDKAVGAVTTNSATAMTAIHEIRLIEKSRSFRANIAVKWVETQM